MFLIPRLARELSNVRLIQRHCDEAVLTDRILRILIDDLSDGARHAFVVDDVFDAIVDVQFLI